MKAIMAFAVIFFVCVVLDGIMEGGGGIATTRLTVDLTEAGTTITVASTEGFMTSDYVMIGDERIRYTSTTATTFAVPVTDGRGYDGTEARAHAAPALVYSPQTSVINGILGFNIASTGASVGTINLFTALPRFAFTTLPKLVTWDFAFFKVSPWMQYFRYLFIVISTGFTIWVIITFASAMGGVLQRIFVR